MTDNRTTELTATDRLRAMLDERGVDWIADDSDVLLVTRWKTENSKPAMYMEPVGECCEGWNNDFSFFATPEQAIAATLGSDASAIRLAERLRSIADEMRSVGASSMSPHELLAFYAHEVDKVADSLMFAATLGSERATHGTLTAEQVSKAVYAHSIHADCADADWLAIADELNAELGSGTCSIVKTWSDSDYVDDWRYRCSECGCFIPVNERDPETGDVINAANYCPNCGREVVYEC